MFPMRKRKQQALKFEVLINVTSMTNLPKKYKHLRVMLTRGAKAVSTNELLAANQRVQPSATEGQMKMISTIYTGGEANRFEARALFRAPRLLLGRMRVSSGRILMGTRNLVNTTGKDVQTGPGPHQSKSHAGKGEKDRHDIHQYGGICRPRPRQRSRHSPNEGHLRRSSRRLNVTVCPSRVGFAE